ncbi:MAG TPA: alpha/beta hydrolase [Cellvibrio sp.]|nr:alpha/beta hydrolase [Cellvibrio sp.]
MNLTEQQLQAFAAQLPPLHFSRERDCNWAQVELAQAYLDLYGINFARTLVGVSHGFGCIQAAGFRIATHYWLPENARGTLLVMHGYYDHVGNFNHIIRFALEHQLAVLAFDLPGHGLSSGDRAAIDSFNQYGDVLAEVLKQSHPLMPQPLYALGQSTGAAVILNYYWRTQDGSRRDDCFEKIVLCAPLILPRGWRAGRFLFAVVRHFLTQLRRGKARSSHDKNFNEFIMQRDCLQTKYLSLQWVGAMKAWDKQFRAYSQLRKEVLIIQGTGDITVDWHYNLPTIQRKLPNAKVTMIQDAGHQLVNESEQYRNQVFAAIASYLAI